MTEPAEAALPEEGTSSNRFTILGRLAGGGMADIYVAKSMSIAGVERYVVLKRVIPGHAGVQFAKMFLDEARLAAQLQHPNIAQVHDVGMLGGAYFFTMEYVHGKDIRGLLHGLSKAKKLLPVNHVVHIAVGALAALHHAHERLSASGEPLGVVHRDVSPSNVMVSYEGAVKLLDFGVAKATQNSEETRSGTIKGKIGYLSPEQCRTGSINRRSDIFSLGIVIHEMITCRRLYRRDSDFNAMNAIVNEPAPPPSMFRDGLPAGLDAIILKALEKRPEDRFSTAAEMLEALEDVATKAHVVPSSSSMGKFMRELFGERPLPWKDLPKTSSEPRIAYTDAAAHTPLPLPRMTTGEHRIVEQLEKAPSLATTSSSESETVSDLPPVLGIPALPREPTPPVLRDERRWLVPVLAALSGAAILAIILVVRGLGSEDAAPNDPPKLEPPSSHSAIGGASTAPTAAAAPISQPAAPTADANVAASVDAPPRTIDNLSATGDWIAVLQVCLAAPRLSPEQHTSCALAACNAKQRSVALDYYQAAPAPSRVAIERACRLSGIVLRTQQPATVPQRQPTTPRVDPCVDDPLACQK